MSVHVAGIMRIMDDSALISILQKTTLHFEGQNSHSTTIYDNLPSEYTQRLMKAIVAFEVEVTEMKSVFKLSQDRDEQSYDNIITKLQEQDEDGRFIANEMRKRKHDVFPYSPDVQ
jgi:transcriptional regulator